jgi:hypothetical protein
MLAMIPVYLGPGNLAGGSRLLHVRAFAHRDGAGTSNLHITLCRRPPYGDAFYQPTTGEKRYFFERPFQTETIAISNTTYAATSEVTFDIGILSALSGEGYLLIEGEPNIIYAGLAACHVGPYTSP